MTQHMLLVEMLDWLSDCDSDEGGWSLPQAAACCVAASSVPGGPAVAEQLDVMCDVSTVPILWLSCRVVVILGSTKAHCCLIILIGCALQGSDVTRMETTNR